MNSVAFMCTASSSDTQSPPFNCRLSGANQEKLNHDSRIGEN
jgi:hypothetical protein